jgi:DNA-binding NarL/FixJ family response regulator
MIEKKKGRSSKYQFLLLEKMFSNDMMEAFSNADSISDILNPFEYNEELLDLEDQLKVEFWRIVEENLTERQREVMKSYASGKTQQEVALGLGINQSSVTKSFWSPIK